MKWKLKTALSNETNNQLFPIFKNERKSIYLKYKYILQYTYEYLLRNL